MIHKPPLPGRLEVKAMVKIMRLMALSVDQQTLLEENNPAKSAGPQRGPADFAGGKQSKLPQA